MDALCKMMKDLASEAEGQPFPLPDLPPVGSKVEHINGHGLGVITGYNQRRGGFYPHHRYPLVVEFEDGYRDVYCLMPKVLELRP